MLFVIVICAVVFSYFVTQAQLPQVLVGWAKAWNFGLIALIAALMIFYIILGCFMDGLGMILITVPVFRLLWSPTASMAVWFGVMLVIVIELGLIPSAGGHEHICYSSPGPGHPGPPHLSRHRSISRSSNCPAGPADSISGNCAVVAASVVSMTTLTSYSAGTGCILGAARTGPGQISRANPDLQGAAQCE